LPKRPKGKKESRSASHRRLVSRQTRRQFAESGIPPGSQVFCFEATRAPPCKRPGQSAHHKPRANRRVVWIKMDHSVLYIGEKSMKVRTHRCEDGSGCPHAGPLIGARGVEKHQSVCPIDERGVTTQQSSWLRLSGIDHRGESVPANTAPLRYWKRVRQNQGSGNAATTSRALLRAHRSKETCIPEHRRKVQGLIVGLLTS